MLNVSIVSLKVSFSAAVLCSLPQFTSFVAVACFHSLGLSLEPNRVSPAQSALGGLDRVK